MADCQVISYQLGYQSNYLHKGSALSLRTEATKVYLEI